jgi:hypothetical protein
VLSFLPTHLIAARCRRHHPAARADPGTMLDLLIIVNGLRWYFHSPCSSNFPTSPSFHSCCCSRIRCSASVSNVTPRRLVLGNGYAGGVIPRSGVMRRRRLDHHRCGDLPHPRGPVRRGHEGAERGIAGVGARFTLSTRCPASGWRSTPTSVCRLITDVRARDAGPGLRKGPIPARWTVASKFVKGDT